MDEITAGESVETTPDIVEETAADSTEQTADEQFDGLMAAAADRMSGVQPAPAPAAETAQDAEVEQAQQQPEEKPAPKEEGPRLVRLKVNGEEIELPEDRLVALAQQGVDYTKKTQALSERSKQVEAWSAVINRIQGDPQLQSRFKALFDGSQAQAPAAQQPQGNEPPADPIDRLKWEIRQEVMAEVEGKIKPLAERPAQLEQAMTLQSFKSEIQRDPVYPQALKLVQQYVANQPEFAREALYQRLDRDPRAFLEVYGPARSHAIAQAQRAQEAKAAKAAPAPEPVKPAVVQRTVKPREAAPTLETAGGAPAAGVESTRRSQDLKTLTKRVRSNQADGQDLVAYLNLTGALKRMG